MIKIFNREQVRKFFAILERLDRSVGTQYEDRKFGSCQKEVFVARTVHKWMDGKCFRFVDEVDSGIRNMISSNRSKPLKIEQMRIVKVGGTRFMLGHGEELSVGISDAANPSSLFNSKSISISDAISLMGEEITREEFDTVYNMFSVETIKCIDCNTRMMHSDIKEDGIKICNACELNRRLKAAGLD